MEPLNQDLSLSELELADGSMLLNVGPAHPAMRGTVRRVVAPSGESRLRAETSHGERGFYVVSKYSERDQPAQKPANLRPRFGSMNMVGGECNR